MAKAEADGTKELRRAHKIGRFKGPDDEAIGEGSPNEGRPTGHASGQKAVIGRHANTRPRT